MKRITAILSALVLLCACGHDEIIVQDNSFSISCEEGVSLSGNVLDMDGKGGSVVLMVNHGPSAAVWSVRSSLDDVWCSFKKNVDMLVVTVEANISDTPREARAGIVMGDKEQELIIRQGFYTPGSAPNLLPDTEWDQNESIYE